MNTVFDVAVPVFGLGILGYAAARCKIFSHDDASRLANFVYCFAAPALLFRTLATAGLDAVPWRLLLGFYAPMALFYFTGMQVARRVFADAGGARIITGFAFSYGNAILLGLPLVLLTFGETGAPAFFVLLAFHSLLAFPATTAALEYANDAGARIAAIGKNILRNPIIIGCIAGIFCNRLNLQLPGPVDSLAALLQQAVTPCALFALGATLSAFSMRGHLTRAAVIIFAKCIAFPLVVWANCRYVFGLELQHALLATLLAAQPVGISVFIFAERYRAAREMASSAVFLSSAFTLISIPILVHIINLQLHPA